MTSVRGRVSLLLTALFLGLLCQFSNAQDRNQVAATPSPFDIAEKAIPQELETLIEDMKSASSKARSRAISGLRNFGIQAQIYAAQLLESDQATPEQRTGLITFLVSENRRGGHERALQARIILDQLTQSEDQAIAASARQALGPDVTTAKSCRGTTICRSTLVSVGPNESYVSYTGYDWVPGKRRPKREYQRIRVWLTGDTVTIDAESQLRSLRIEVGSDDFRSRFPAVASRVTHELTLHERRTRGDSEPADEPESGQFDSGASTAPTE